MQNNAHAAIPELDEKGLREFGLVTGGIVVGLFGLLIPWLFGLRFPLWPWILFVVLAAWALIAPATLRMVYRPWMRFGLFMSRITTPILLGAVFFLTVVPTAFVVRLFGRDPMARRLDDDVQSYRVPSKKAPRDNLERPF